MSRITRRKFVGDVSKASLAATIVPRHVLGPQHEMNQYLHREYRPGWAL